jgi:hypothetical protein
MGQVKCEHMKARASQNLSVHPECISESSFIDFVQRSGIPKQVRNDHITKFCKALKE